MGYIYIYIVETPLRDNISIYTHCTMVIGLYHSMMERFRRSWMLCVLSYGPRASQVS